MDGEAIERARRLCQKLTKDVEPIEEECRLAQWEAECTGADEAFGRVQALRTRIMQRLASTEDFVESEHLLSPLDPSDAESSAWASPMRHSSNGPLARELFRWRNRLAAHQLGPEMIQRLAADETAIIQQYNSFRADLAGRPASDNEIDRVLAESRQSTEVEAAWRASKRISRWQGPDGTALPVVEKLLGLVRLRNEAARRIGYSDAYEASLRLNELDPNWLFETLDVLDQATAPLFEEWKATVDRDRSRRFAITTESLRPWHYGDRFFQTPPVPEESDELDQWLRAKDIVKLAERTFDELGFDIRPIIERSDLLPGDPAASRKCQHAFCTTIRAPGDVRVLCNIVPGRRWMSTTLHEFGHAIYGASLDPTLPYSLRDDPHTLVNEAIALLMERHLLDAGWLGRVAGLPPARAEEMASGGRARLAVKHLVFTRWVLVMCHFERRLYQYPDQCDLGRLWWDLVERFQMVRRPAPQHTDHDWAAKIHFVGYPAYYQNYLLGEVFGAQLQHAIERQCGTFAGNPEAGRALRDRVFRPGAVPTWQELLESATGEPFDPKYLVATLRAWRP